MGAAVWLGSTAPAHADTPEDLGRHAGDTVTQYAFDDQLVDGDDVSPTLEVLHVRKQRRGGSLVRARSAFVDRLLKSIEAL